MNVIWIDLIVGILLVESILHLSFAHSGNYMPSLFGKSLKANMIFSIVTFFVSFDIYFYTYGISTLVDNSLLLGVFVAYLCYLIFGHWFHKRLQRNTATVNT